MPDMASLKVVGDRLLVRLNPLERLADLRLRSPSAPIEAVREVTVVDRPGKVLVSDVDLGFAGNTAPFGFVVTASSRAKFQGGRAAVFVYLRRRSVRVDLEEKEESRGGCSSCPAGMRSR